MVRTLIVALTIIGINFVVCLERYIDKYDNIAVEPILENDRLRNEYYRCFLHKGPCITASAKYFREFILEAFVNDCAKCTDTQKVKIQIIKYYYMIKIPDQWKEIQNYIKEHKHLVTTIKPPQKIS